MRAKRFHKLMYKKLDGTLSAKELEIFINEWNNSESFRSEYNQILELREEINKSGVHSFKPLFEERILDKLNSGIQPESTATWWSNTLTISFRQIAFVAIIILAILVTYNIKSDNIYSIKNVLGKSQSNIEYAFDPVQNLLKDLKQ
jgi:hypothetical protein